MTTSEAEALLSKHPRIKIESPDLIGFELLSRDVASTDSCGMVAIAKMILDCNGQFGRRIPYHLAESKTGTLTVWVLPPPPIQQ
jgi:hypothetical protein